MLNVICNPFTHLDHEGLPAGALPFEPSHHGGARRWVGASIDASKTKLVKPAAGSPAAAVLRGRKVAYAPTPMQRTVFAHDLSPQQVPDTAYYRQAIRCGDIFAADRKTAEMVGIKFVPPEQVLAKARDAAVATFAAETGAKPDFSLWPEPLRPKGATASSPEALSSAGSFT